MMQTQANKYELLSALADGELARGEMDQALAEAAEDGHACWATYQLIGDVLRDPSLARQCDTNKLLEGVRLAVRQGELNQTIAPAQVVDVPPQLVDAPASNDSVFRWKMVAGFASMAAVAAIGWNSFNEWSGAANPGAQMASVTPSAMTTPALDNAQVSSLQASTAPQIMMRDPRLDELLAAHQQFGRANTLQMPAGFLRNATFNAPQK